MFCTLRILEFKTICLHFCRSSWPQRKLNSIFKRHKTWTKRRIMVFHRTSKENQGRKIGNWPCSLVYTFRNMQKRNSANFLLLFSSFSQTFWQTQMARFTVMAEISTSNVLVDRWWWPNRVFVFNFRRTWHVLETRYGKPLAVLETLSGASSPMELIQN